MVSPLSRNFSRKKGSAEVDTDTVRGVPIDAGPHIAIVKHNADATRRGRISVWTEILGDRSEDENTWVQVQYASPYFSHTEDKGVENDYDNIRHTAGMWVPSPELGSKVLITFPGGDRHNGVWFACIPDRFNNRMMPGLASSTNFDAESDTHGPSGTAEFKHEDGSYDTVQPVGEFIEKRQADAKDYHVTPVDIEGQLKPINYHMARKYKEQGLNADLIRGHTTSSAQRETPSEVFGISTKGRRYHPVKSKRVEEGFGRGSNNELDEKALMAKLEAGQVENLKSEEKAFLRGANRKPGHSFVMDDGELNGDSELVRLRSASGHQVLLHDTKGVVYIGNATGNVWLEFSNDGKVDLYAKDSINFRTKNFNFHADANINFYSASGINMVTDGILNLEGNIINQKSNSGSIFMDSKNSIHMKGASGINIDSSAALNIRASADVKIDGSHVALGNGAGVAESLPGATRSTKPDTILDRASFWKSYPNKITSVTDRIPTHEPFASRDIIEQTGTTKQTKVNTQELLATIDVATIQQSLGLQQALAQTLDPNQLLSAGDLITQPEPSGGQIGEQLLENKRRLLAMIGKQGGSGL